MGACVGRALRRAAHILEFYSRPTNVCVEFEHAAATSNQGT